MPREDLAAFFCPKLVSTQALAASLGQRVLSRDVIVLQGELGAGKTTFASAFIEETTTSRQAVGSPTFPIVQEYASPWGKLLHCDFYRLQEGEEIAEFGLEEAFGRDVILIEWAERLPPGFLPQRSLIIKFELLPAGRLLRFCGGDTWRSRVESLALPLA